MSIQELYSARKPVIKIELESATDLAAAIDSVIRALDAVRRDYQSLSPETAHEAFLLFDSVNAALKCALSASKFEMWTLSPPKNSTGAVKRAARLLPFIPALASCGTMLWLWGAGHPVMGALAFAATAAATLISTKAPQLPKSEINVKVDVAAMLSFLDRLVIAMDRALEERIASASKEQAPPAVQDGLWEPLQMLIEARYTGDGAYALRAVPSVIGWLQGMGVTVVDYSPENARYFDLYPSTEPGVTIRPALFRGDELLARGQATGEA